MTQMMLSFDTPQSDYVAGTDYSASAAVAVPVVVPSAARQTEDLPLVRRRSPADAAGPNAAGLPTRAGGQMVRHVGGHVSEGEDQTAHRMGDLARLVLMRYDLVAQRQSSLKKKRRR